LAKCRSDLVEGGAHSHNQKGLAKCRSDLVEGGALSPPKTEAALTACLAEASAKAGAAPSNRTALEGS
jgi:hypothetical protein